MNTPLQKVNSLPSQYEKKRRSRPKPLPPGKKKPGTSPTYSHHQTPEDHWQSSDQTNTSPGLTYNDQGKPTGKKE